MLLSSPDFSAQLPDSAESADRLRRGVAPGGHGRLAQLRLQRKFSLCALLGFGKLCQLREASSQVSDGLMIGRTVCRFFAGALPISDRLGWHTGLAAMVRHQLGIGFNHIGELLFQQLSDLAVILLARAPQ